MGRFFWSTSAVSETCVRSHRGRISVCRRRQFLTLPFPAGERVSQASVAPIETSDRGRFPGREREVHPTTWSFGKAGGLGPGRNNPGAPGLGSFLLPFIPPGSLSAWKQESLKTVKEKSPFPPGIPWVLGLLIVLQLLGTVSRPLCPLHLTTGGRRCSYVL